MNHNSHKYLLCSDVPESAHNAGQGIVTIGYSGRLRRWRITRVPGYAPARTGLLNRIEVAVKAPNVDGALVYRRRRKYPIFSLEAPFFFACFGTRAGVSTPLTDPPELRPCWIRRLLLRGAACHKQKHRKGDPTGQQQQRVQSHSGHGAVCPTACPPTRKGRASAPHPSPSLLDESRHRASH